MEWSPNGWIWGISSLVVWFWPELRIPCSEWPTIWTSIPWPSSMPYKCSQESLSRPDGQVCLQLLGELRFKLGYLLLHRCVGNSRPLVRSFQKGTHIRYMELPHQRRQYSRCCCCGIFRWTGVGALLHHTRSHNRRNGLSCIPIPSSKWVGIYISIELLFLKNLLIKERLCSTREHVFLFRYRCSPL